MVRVGVMLNTQEGMYTINTDVQNRYNINMNLNTNINKWLDVATKISYNTSNYNEPYMNYQKGKVWEAMKNDRDLPCISFWRPAMFPSRE